MFVLLRPFRLLLQALLTESTPRQMSLGLAFGVLVGVVPKGNLLAMVLATLLAATRVNLAIATVAVVACTLGSGGLDTLFDKIGCYILSMPSLQSLWIEMANTPFMPWTDFNNSIVMGSFISGLILVYPIHRLSRPVFEKYAGRMSNYARRFRFAKLIFGAEWADRISSIQ